MQMLHIEERHKIEQVDTSQASLSSQVQDQQVASTSSQPND
jgi:hypothetical protein